MWKISIPHGMGVYELYNLTDIYLSIFPNCQSLKALCAMDAVSSTKLFYSWPMICKGEVWRLVTNFFYFGSLNLDFLFHMYFLVRARLGIVSREIS